MNFKAGAFFIITMLTGLSIVDNMIDFFLNYFAFSMDAYNIKTLKLVIGMFVGLFLTFGIYRLFNYIAAHNQPLKGTQDEQ